MQRRDVLNRVTRAVGEVIRRWMRRERRASFVAVEVRGDAPAGGAVAEVLLAGGRVLRVPASIDAATLVRLVRALESC